MSNDVQGLKFDKVDDTCVNPNLELVTTLMAILTVHNALPHDDNGIATVTIRQLLRQFAPGIHPILAEYVCAFGKHGLAVLDRYVTNNIRDEEGRKSIQATVTTKANQFASKL